MCGSHHLLTHDPYSPSHPSVCALQVTDLTRKVDVQANRAMKAEASLKEAEKRIKAQDELSATSAEHIMALEV